LIDKDSVNLIAEAESLEVDPEKDCYPLPGPDHAIDAGSYAVAAGMGSAAPGSTAGAVVKADSPTAKRLQDRGIGADRRGGGRRIRDSL